MIVIKILSVLAIVAGGLCLLGGLFMGGAASMSDAQAAGEEAGREARSLIVFGSAVMAAGVVGVLLS